MLYNRSAFLAYLVKIEECEIIPLNEKVIRIKNGSATANMWMDGKNRIDYEEIYILYKKLYLRDLPGDKDLVRIE